MPFEWQEQEQAARTLGVDAQTLQAWIDSGHAPTRVQNGRVEVLIEFPDEEADPRNPQDPRNPPPGGADGKAGRTEAAPGAGDPGGQAPPSGKEEAFTPLREMVDVVPRRELQLAGGMVAAWQRLAETSDRELVRSRRWGLVAWAAVALLALAGAIGLWWATREISASRAQARGGQNLLEERERLEAAQQQALLRQQELAGRMADTQSQMTQTQAETAQLVAALRQGLDEQRRRLEALESELAATRQTLADTQGELTTARQALADAQGELTAARQALADTQGELTAARQTLTDTQGELTAARQALAATQAQLTAAQQRAADLQAQLDAQPEAPPPAP